jgi:hypothetical protein
MPAPEISPASSSRTMTVGAAISASPVAAFDDGGEFEQTVHNVRGEKQSSALGLLAG